MRMTNNEYSDYVKRKSPKSPLVKDLIKAFLVGGLICCIGQLIMNAYSCLNMTEENASAATSVTMVFIGAFLTGIGVYDTLGKYAGAGTLVPITGFANSVVSPALEFKAEGFITGTAAKMFVIAGPVLVFGVSASVVYGFIYWFFTYV